MTKEELAALALALAAEMPPALPPELPPDPLKGNTPPPERFDAVIKQKNEAILRGDNAEKERDWYKQQYEQSLGEQQSSDEEETVALPFLTTDQFQQYRVEQEQEKQNKEAQALWNNLQTTVTKTVVDNPYMNADALELAFIKQPELLNPQNLGTFIEEQKSVYLAQKQKVIDEYVNSVGQKPPISSGSSSMQNAPLPTSWETAKERFLSRLTGQ